MWCWLPNWSKFLCRRQWLFNGRSRLWRWLLCALLGLGLTAGLPVVSTLAQPPPLERAQVLNRQGEQYLTRGNPQAALESWLQAETLYRHNGNVTGAIGSQLNQAKALQALGFYRRAHTLLEQIVVTQRQQPDSSLKANGLLTLGNILRLVGDYPASRQVLSESLEIAQRLNSLPDMQAAYLHLGNTLLAQQQAKEALDYFSQAAAIAAPLQLSARLRQLKLFQQLDRPPEATALLAQIETQLEVLPPSQISIYGRIELAKLIEQATAKALTATQAVTPPLRSAQLLATAAQQARTLGDRSAESYAIGRLGHLYEQSQQWAEAERLTQIALKLARTANVPEITYQWHWQMGRILQAQHDLAAATTAYIDAVQILQSLRKDLVAIGQDVQFSFRNEVEPVYRELVGLLLQSEASQTHLNQARQMIEALQLAELNNFFREACLDATVRPVDTVDPTAAVFYPIILRDRLEVILSLPNQPLRHYATPLPEAEIEAGIQQMRSSLRSTSFLGERLAAAQRLYRWLIQPGVADLNKYQMKTLVFVLDGSLRNIPMAALHDGEHYLIEQYQLALTPGLQLFSSRQIQREQIYALVGGLSEGVAGASPLPGVEQEVSQIRQQIPAQVLLNQTFTTQALKAQAQTIPFNVVHLATHGQFSSNISDTYVQTWDGHLNVNDLQTLIKQRSLSSQSAIELLVLSACQTAAGDSRATLGMAGVAVRSGARSTLATLWRVNDASTAAFIAAFYQALAQPNVNKAQAVQAAQISLIKSAEFKHPYYWAPFVLVGNWL